MRGTFCLRSSTFAHQLDEMRQKGDGDGQKFEARDQQPPCQDSEICDNKLADGQLPFVDTGTFQQRASERSDNEHSQSCDGAEETHDRGEDRSSSLLPGLPDEMTIDHILTKVPWIAFLFSLPAVSTSWLHAIRNLHVHEARIRTKTTQTLIAIIHQTLVRKSKDLSRADRQEDADDFVHALAISLYDPGADRWYLLPAIAGVDRGIPYACECVCLQGKLYILGGYGNFCPSKAVYVLDLAAGISVWRQCAPMNSARVGFSGSANDGKLYVFGGTRSGTFETTSACLEAEVFDPEINTWSSIAPTFHRHISHSVACVGGEFIIHGGRCWTDIDADDDSINSHRDHNRTVDRVAEVYDPYKDEWRVVKNFAVGIIGAPVVVDNQLHIISERDNSVYLYNKPDNSWSASQSISWKGLGFEPSPASNVVIEATAWEGEILAAMCSWNVSRFMSGLENWEDQIVLLTSKGLGDTDKELEWERIASADEFHKQILCMRCIQL